MSQSQENADESGSTQEGWGYGVWHWVWLQDEQARGSGMLTELLQRERCMILGAVSHREAGSMKRVELSTEELKQTIPVCKLVAELEKSSSLWFCNSIV